MSEMWKDLGLTYMEAAHAMQTGVAYEMTLPDRKRSTEPKHLRTGINSAMVEHSALVGLLIKKGIISKDEYMEELRLAMNHEVWRYEQDHPGMKFR